MSSIAALLITTCVACTVQPTETSGKPCGAITEDGTCVDQHYLICQDSLLQDYDCIGSGWSGCGFLVDGRATCTNPCPPEATVAGACDGAHLSKCDGTAYIDTDCDAGQIYGYGADGVSRGVVRRVLPSTDPFRDLRRRLPHRL